MKGIIVEKDGTIHLADDIPCLLYTSTLFTKDILFFKVMKNTFVYVIAYVGLNVIIALGMAVWITSLKKANQFFRSVFFLPMMVAVSYTHLDVYKRQFISGE